MHSFTMEFTFFSPNYNNCKISIGFPTSGRIVSPLTRRIPPSRDTWQPQRRVAFCYSNQIRANRTRYLFRYRFDPSGVAIFAMTIYRIEPNRRSKLALYCILIRSIDRFYRWWNGKEAALRDNQSFVVHSTLYDNRFIEGMNYDYFSFLILSRSKFLSLRKL